MSDSEENFTCLSDSEIENISNKLNNLMINIKPDIKPEMNPNISDLPSTSRPTSSYARRKPGSGNSFVSSLMNIAKQKGYLDNEGYTLLDRTTPEAIFPFGTFLDLDCVKNTEEAIDKWEIGLRLAVSINKLSYEESKGFLERSLVNSVSRYWKTLPEETKSIIFGEEQDINSMITRALELIRLEFVGEESYFKDVNSVQKYTDALLKLTLYDMCEVIYLCFSRLLL